MNRKAIIIGTAVHLALANAQGEFVEISEERRFEPQPDNGIPDRLSIERGSRFYTSVGGYVGVRLNGEDVNGRVVEFCTSEGWARLVDPSLSGKPLGRLEVESATRHNGVVETYWRMQPSRQIRRQLARIA